MYRKALSGGLPTNLRKATFSNSRINTLCPRSVSTETSSGESWVDPEYIPGKQGYMPGFAPPVRKLKNLKPKKKEEIPVELPKPSAFQSNVLPKTANSKRLYKQAMKRMRYEFRLNSVRLEQERKERREKSFKEGLEREKKKVEARRAQREIYNRNIRNDPLSAYNVLNPEGMTTLPNLRRAENNSEAAANTDSDNSVQNKTETLVKSKSPLDVDSPLKPPRVTVLVDTKAIEERRRERFSNHKELLDRKHEERLELLMKLYHHSKSFVTYENLEQAIKDFHIGTNAILQQSIQDLVQDFEDAGGVVGSREIGDRTLQLKHALDGTSGKSAQHLGVQGLKSWIETNVKE
ncbi:hypothetical protein H4219_000757 [Mycoemilia scoparia]|uniref:Uncharacterized protein n=1 Tax=Mycoemilia scoparia TaxID=417184 RepID=A0A9W8A9T6_9FUNG|nr:hypothetical protein H4219_000757 [Mycoemilia scoparia]